MTFEYKKLRGKLAESYLTQSSLAQELNIGRTSLNRKLNNHIEFTQFEILRICNILKIPYNEIPQYFFTPKVQKREQ